MYYYASLNNKGVCVAVYQYETEQTEDVYTVQIDSYDTSLVYRKKYLHDTQTWVDCLPSETDLPMSDRIGYSPTDEWLTDKLGILSSLETTAKGSLVAAINECFQFAGDGKSTIADAITGVDSEIVIPDNPTFAQLAALIGQLGGLKVATGNVQDFTIPSSISGNTAFTPKLVIVYNVGTGITNVNIGIYVSSALIGTQISDSVYGLGGTLTRRANSFTITSAGFTYTNFGSVTNLKWLALG